MTALPIPLEESTGDRADKTTGVYIPDELVTMGIIPYENKP